MPFAFDSIFVSGEKCTLGLGLGNRVTVRVSFRVSIRLIRYSAMTGGAI